MSLSVGKGRWLDQELERPLRLQGRNVSIAEGCSEAFTTNSAPLGSFGAFVSVSTTRGGSGAAAVSLATGGSSGM